MKKIALYIVMVFMLFSLFACSDGTETLTTSNWEQYIEVSGYCYSNSNGNKVYNFIGALRGYDSAKLTLYLDLKEGYEAVEDVVVEFEIKQEYKSLDKNIDAKVRQFRYSGRMFIKKGETMDVLTEIVEVDDPIVSALNDPEVTIISISGKVRAIENE